MITTWLRSIWQRLGTDQQGAVAISFAIFLVVGVGLFLFANDLARHNVITMRLQNSLDAALLSTASKYSSLNTTEDPDVALSDDAQAFLDANFPSGYLEAVINTPTLELSADDTLSMRATGDMNLWSKNLIPNDFEVFPLMAYNEVSLPGGGGGGEFEFDSGAFDPDLGGGCAPEYNMGPFFPSGTKNGETVPMIILGAFLDHAEGDDGNNNVHFRDVFYTENNLWPHDSSHFQHIYCTDVTNRCGANKPQVWADSKTYPMVSTGHNLIAVSSYPEVFNSHLAGHFSIGAHATNSLPRYGERLVLAFRKGEKSGDCQTSTELKDKYDTGITEVSVPLVNMTPNAEARLAVFYDDTLASRHIKPSVFTYRKDQLDNGYAHVKSPNGQAINRIVIGTEQPPGYSYEFFAVGTDIRLKGEGDGGNGGSTTDLRLSK